LSAFIKRVRSVFNPHMYHGWGRKRTYFEGWYYKLVSADEQHALAIIPGIAMDEFGNKEAFIQVFDGKHAHAAFFAFPASAFRPNERRFEIDVASNHFTSHGLQLNLKNAHGKLEFTNQTPWPSSWYSPGIMGPAAFVPYLQCYHGVLSMNHVIKGVLTVNGNSIDFSGGKGYLEKDWGRSFPKAYFWMQCNHFNDPDLAVKASVAHVSWLGRNFTGLIAGVQHGDRLIQFTTYNFTRLTHAAATETSVQLNMGNGRYNLQLDARIHETTALLSPIQGLMDGKVNESMTAELHMRLTEKRTGTTLFDDAGRNAAVDKGGEIELLFT
jgi:tocopherol cyclase